MDQRSETMSGGDISTDTIIGDGGSAGIGDGGTRV
jgi:hypothetical protein